MIRRPPRSTQSRSSAASDVYKRQALHRSRPPSGQSTVASWTGKSPDAHDLLRTSSRGCREETAAVEFRLHCGSVCRERHPAAADHPPRTTEPDAAHQQHGGAAVRRRRGPGADGTMVQERAPADARRAPLHTPKHRLSADRRSVIIVIIIIIGPIPWGHSGPLSHALSSSWTSMRRRRATPPVATPGEW